MSALIDKHPEYRQVKIIRVDWDQFAKAPIARELNVPRRSTLIAFRGGKERARVMAGTSERQLGGLFEAALKDG